MLLFEPQHTPYDLRWRMFGVDIRVHPMFWLLSIILGFSLLQNREHGISLLLIWIGCVFFSILLHEFGHVLMFRAFGVDAHIVLFAFGGLAIPDRGVYGHWKRILVSLAGPVAQLLFYALVYFLNTLAADQGMLFHPLVYWAIVFLLVINLGWALLNLLPIYPLDGGQISRDLLDFFLPNSGIRLSLIVSLVVAIALTIHCIKPEWGLQLLPFLPVFGTYSGIMFAMLALQSFQMLQEHSNPPWRREG